jgi:hypothetical protein
MTKSSLSPKLLCVGIGILAGSAANHAVAQSQYFTTVANSGTYSWDAANWNTSGSTANTGPYTFNWTPGDFARFYNGASDNFTVTVNASESMAGLFLNAGASAQVNINDAGSGTGSLNIVAGTSQLTQNGFTWSTQGFLTGGGIATINAPIAGSGGVEEESGGGHLQLYGNNTYTGGTLFTSSSTFVDYNNNNSFGATSSQIGYDGTTFSIMENTGPTTVNIANPVQVAGTTGVNFIGNSATMSGTWTLGANTVNIRNNGTATTETLSGAMTGSGTVTFSGANGGIIKLTGANSLTGPIVVGSSGDTAVRLLLGAPNTIAGASGVTLAGGTLDLGGFNHTMGSTTLGLTANSAIDFESISALTLANSSALSWSGVLDLLNWVPGTTELQFGTDATGLTAGELADIEFNGTGLGDAAINSLGQIYETPEPSTISLGLIGGLASLGIMWRARRSRA